MTDINYIWQDYGLDHLEEGINSLFPEKRFSMMYVLERLICADLKGAWNELWGGFLQGTVGNVEDLKQIFVSLLLIGIASAFAVDFINLFDAKQISDLGFYFIYLCLALILTCSFRQISELADSSLDKMIRFHEVLFPTYLLTVGMATGTATATVSHQIVLLIIYGIEILFRGVVLPMIKCYMILAILNGIWSDDHLLLFVRLIGRGIHWILNISLWAVTGVGFFQSVLTPVIDSTQNSVLRKVIASIPGIGDAAQGSMEVVMGTAHLIKNSVGVVLLILLLGLCMGTLLKIGGTCFVLKAAAACMGPIGDKRVAKCTDMVGESMFFLLRMVATTMLLFGITIGVVIVTSAKF